MNYVMEKMQFTPELEKRGTKVIPMEVDNVQLIDHLNYMPVALFRTSKAFDLKPEKK